MVSPILELNDINKSFGHVQANKNINLKINKGTIHGIIGENGAGKSTLMSIVFGLYQANSGSIKINGKEIIVRNARSGEKIVTLDEINRDLNKEDLLICNDKNPMCLSLIHISEPTRP